ncbi:MAG: tyrosine-type recombinase/integrase [Hyphomicrobiales bacterium]
MSKKQKLKYLKRYTKGGLDYCYFRPSNKRIMAEFGTAAFYVEFAKAEEHWKAKTLPTSSVGTLGHLITEYKKSPKFKKLAVRTRTDYLKYHNYLQPISQMLVANIDTVFVRKLRDKAESTHYPHYANYVLSALSAVFSWGVQYGLARTNPVKGVERISRDKSLPDANRRWSEGEVEAMLTAPIHLRLPISISINTGLRIGDILALNKNAIKDGYLTKRTNKTGFKVECPINDELRLVLDAAPENGTLFLCCNSRGTPWTESGFKSSFATFKSKMLNEGKIEPELTFHGIRHTIGAKLKEAGFSHSEVAISLGDVSEEMGRVYSRGAENKRHMVRTLEALKRTKHK